MFLEFFLELWQSTLFQFFFEKKKKKKREKKKRSKLDVKVFNVYQRQPYGITVHTEWLARRTNENLSLPRLAQFMCAKKHA